MERLEQHRMKKVLFKNIKYKKIINITDYLDLRNDIENCFIDEKGININKLNEYKIEIRNEIEKVQRNIEMRASFAFPICIMLPSAILGFLAPVLYEKQCSMICVVIIIIVFVFLFGLLVCWINENFYLKKDRDILVFYNTINEIFLYISENIEILKNKEY